MIAGAILVAVIALVLLSARADTDFEQWRRRQQEAAWLRDGGCS